MFPGVPWCPLVFPGVGGPKRVQRCSKDTSNVLQRGARIPPADAVSNSSFLAEPSVPKYCHAGSRDGVIRCQTALWSGLGVAPSRRSPGSYTWSLQWPALGPTLNAPFGVSKPLPGPFWLAWAWAAPGWSRGLGYPPLPPARATQGWKCCQISVS